MARPDKRITTMKRLLLAAAALAALASTPVFAKQCVDDTISSKSDDGDILVMQSGHVYQTQDTVNSSLWMELDNVLICDGREIINTDENGEKVAAEKLKWPPAPARNPRGVHGHLRRRSEAWATNEAVALR
jgi:hypothetical protein